MRRVQLRALVLVLAVAVGVGAWPGAGRAQTFRAGVAVESFSFSEPEISGLSRASLVRIPVAAMIPVLPGFHVDVAGGFAAGQVAGAGGEDASVSGIMDTRVGATFRLAGGRLGLRASVNAPGRSASTLEGLRVTGVLASELLPFETSPWVGAAGLSASAETVLGGESARLGLSAGYGLWQSYRVLDPDGFAYRPGPVVRAKARGDFRLGRTRLLSLSVGVQRYGADAAGGEDAFRSGVRLDGYASLAFPVGVSASAVVYGGARRRSGGTAILSDYELPGIGDARARDLFLAGVDGHAETRLGVLLPTVGFRLLRSEKGTCYRWHEGDAPGTSVCPGGQGWMVSSGLAMALPVGRGRRTRLHVVPSVQVHVGRIIDWGGGAWIAASDVQRGGEGSPVVGWTLGVTVHRGGRR